MLPLLGARRVAFREGSNAGSRSGGRPNIRGEAFMDYGMYTDCGRGGRRKNKGGSTDAPIDAPGIAFKLS